MLWSTDSCGQDIQPATRAPHPKTLPLPISEASRDALLRYTFELPPLSPGQVFTLSHVASRWVYNSVLLRVFKAPVSKHPRTTFVISVTYGPVPGSKMGQIISFLLACWSPRILMLDANMSI